jgi:bifunctional ADP-heptose synthase (sugar kinase/adenylyltransferase)
MKKHKVLLSQEQRSIVIDALRCIQFVHAAQISTLDVLNVLQPAVYVKGSDWMVRGGIPQEEQQLCDAIGIEVKYLDTILNSSSNLLKKWEDR